MKKILMAVLVAGAVNAAHGETALGQLERSGAAGSSLVNYSSAVIAPAVRPAANTVINTAIMYSALAAQTGVGAVLSAPPGFTPDVQEQIYALGNAYGLVNQLKELMEIGGCRPSGVDIAVVHDKVWGLSGYVFAGRTGKYMVPKGNRARLEVQMDEINAALVKIIQSLH